MFSSNTQPPSFKIVNSDHQTSCCIFLLERFVSLAKVIRKKLNVTLISLPPIHICIMCMRTCTLTQCIYTCIYIYTYRFEDLCRTVCTKCVDINISIYSVYIFYIYLWLAFPCSPSPPHWDPSPMLFLLGWPPPWHFSDLDRSKGRVLHIWIFYL